MNHQRNHQIGCDPIVRTHHDAGKVNVCFSLDPDRLVPLKASEPTSGDRTVFCDIVVTHEQARLLADRLLSVVEAAEEEEAPER